MQLFVLILSLSLSCSTLAAAPESAVPAKETSPETWEMLRERMLLLNNISYLPSLLPVIMKNRHALELTQSQVAAFRQWRSEHYQEMEATMNVIIEKRIALSQAAVQPDIPASALIAMQDDIFVLQRKLFQLRLSCRELVTGTFTDEQWSNLAFVAAEDPQIAGLLIQ
jgi:hypothetical protein